MSKIPGGNEDACQISFADNREGKANASCIGGDDVGSSGDSIGDMVCNGDEMKRMKRDFTMNEEEQARLDLLYDEVQSRKRRKKEERNARRKQKETQLNFFVVGLLLAVCALVILMAYAGFISGKEISFNGPVPVSEE